MIRRVAALAAFALMFAVPVFAQQGVARGELVWRTSSNIVGGGSDSTSFSYGTAGAGVDTSRWTSTRCIRTGILNATYIPTADSTIWLRFNLMAQPGFAHSGGTSNTVTIQGSADASNPVAITNMAVLPLTEIGSSDCYTLALSMGKAGVAGLQLITLPYIRFIVTSNDLVGSYTGAIDYVTNCPSIVNGLQP